MRTLIVIPARLNSKRLPRKLLLQETGKAVISHVVDQACQCKRPGDIMIAAPDDAAEIWAAIARTSKNYSKKEIGNSWGWPRVVATDPAHPNGTSRAAQVMLFADQLDERPHGWWEAYCVVQADYPEIPPALIDEVIEQLEKHPEWGCATAASSFPEELNAGWVAALDRNKVKAFFGEDYVALDFTRNDYHSLPHDPFGIGIHVGIYCYRRAALARYAAAGPCQREQDESLEQLRALHIGLKMGVVLTSETVHGIDTREDYDAFVARYRASLDSIKSPAP